MRIVPNIERLLFSDDTVSPDNFDIDGASLISETGEGKLLK